MMSLMRMLLSTTLLCCVLGETNGSAFLGKAKAATNTFTEAATGVDATLSGLAGAVADQIRSWEDTSSPRSWVAMKEWSSTAAGIVSQYSHGAPLRDAAKNQAMKHMPRVFKVVTGSPLLAFGATAFVSLFGEREAGKVAALQKQLYAQVRKFIDVYKKGFTGELENVKQRMTTLTLQIQGNIAYAEDAPAGADASWYAERDSFWEIMEYRFRASVEQVFSPACVHKDAKGASTKCEEFQFPGAIAFQVPFALTHITILLQRAQFAQSDAAQHHYILAAKQMAGSYYHLLKDSLDYYSYVLGVLKGGVWQKQLHAAYDGILKDIQAVAKAK